MAQIMIASLLLVMVVGASFGAPQYGGHHGHGAGGNVDSGFDGSKFAGQGVGTGNSGGIDAGFDGSHFAGQGVGTGGAPIAPVAPSIDAGFDGSHLAGQGVGTGGYGGR